MNLYLGGTKASEQSVHLQECKRQRRKQNEGVRHKDRCEERGRHILMGKKLAEGIKEEEREWDRRMKERRCEKQKKYPLDSRCPSNGLVLVGWLVAGLEVGWRRRRQRYEMTGREQHTYIQASARTACYSTCPVRKDPEVGRSERELMNRIHSSFDAQYGIYDLVQWSSVSSYILFIHILGKNSVINRVSLVNPLVL